MRALVNMVVVAAMLGGRVASPDDIPACRLIGRDQKAVFAAVEAIRANWPSSAPKLPFASVGVNRAGSELTINLVSDLDDGLADPKGCPKKGTATGEADGKTILRVCKPKGSSRIDCSADAVHALVDADPQQRALNLGLVVLLAHEFSHLAHKDDGGYVSPLTPISLADDRTAKLVALKDACHPMSQSNANAQKVKEDRADGEALDVMEAVAYLEIKKDPTAGKAGARALALGSLEASMGGLREWGARWLGRRDVPPIETPKEGDDSKAFAHWAAERRICDALAPGKGFVLVPVAAADHALGSVRLAQLSLRLGSIQAPDDGALHSIGNASDLLTKIGGVFVVIDRQEAEADAAMTQQFCESMVGGVPDCTHVPNVFPHKEPECPEVHAKVTWEKFEKGGTDEPANWSEKTVSVGARTLTFAHSWTDGSLLIGAKNEVGFARPHQPVHWFEVPCLPRDAVLTEDGAKIVCDHPLGAIRTNRARPVAIALAHAVYDGEPDDANSQFTWAGPVLNKSMAVFVSGSGSSRTIDVSSDDWVTATPWLGRGCDILVFGMAIGVADGRITGAVNGHPSVRRTARFDETFSRATTFTARDRRDVLGCGVGPHSPLCLSEAGELFDPEPEKPTVVARLRLDGAVKTSPDQEATICSSRAHTFVLVTGRGGARPVAQLFQVEGKAATSVAREYDKDEGVLRCDAIGATTTLSNGLSSEVLMLREQH